MVKEDVEGKRPPARAHSVIMEERRRAMLTGITDVVSFNEQEIVMLTEEGELSLAGEDLHISLLNLEDGKLTVEGRIAAIEYGDGPAQRRGGILARVFR